MQKVKANQFCALATDGHFHNWLQSYAPDLLDELQATIKTGSCKSNSAKMQDILDKLEQRGKTPALIRFLNDVFPFVIEEIRKADIKPVNLVFLIKNPVNSIFKFYNPYIVSFPQKVIFQNKDVEALKRIIQSFSAGKLAVDFIIIGDLGYIEYFKPKYAKEAKIFPESKREIVQYRLHKGLVKDIRQI